jgi:hypothetical protein
VTRADLIARLRLLEPKLRSSGISALYLFGSRARDEASPASDIDLFVDPVNEDTFTLSDFSRTYGAIEQAFPGMDIGYSTRDGLVPVYRAYVERDAIQVF